MSLYLVCHAGPSPDRWARRLLVDRLPERGAHFSAPEPQALATARLVTAQPVEVVEGLRSQECGLDAPGGHDATVVRGLLLPDLPAGEGWEPASRVGARVIEAVAAILQRLPQDDIVLVGHPVCWTVLSARLCEEEPDPDFWAGLGTPDLIRLDRVGPLSASTPARWSRPRP